MEHGKTASGSTAIVKGSSYICKICKYLKKIIHDLEMSFLYKKMNQNIPPMDHGKTASVSTAIVKCKFLSSFCQYSFN